MRQILFLFLAGCLFIFNSNKALATFNASELPECIVVTHCVREDWEVNDIEKSFNKVIEAESNTPRTKIVEQIDFYIHAEAKTKWRGYTDDLLVKALPERNIIQVRSESRVGIGDNGFNKRRVDDLSYRLTTNQLK